jgi:hypothetical protein
VNLDERKIDLILDNKWLKATTGKKVKVVKKRETRKTADAKGSRGTPKSAPPPKKRGSKKPNKNKGKRR